jgi:hypothetical protein
MSATTRRVGVIPELSTASSTGNCESLVREPKKGLDGQSYGCMTKDVLRDFGSKAWGTPPGQTGGVYPFLGLEIFLGQPSTPLWLRNSPAARS